jgi:hypothetical protein
MPGAGHDRALDRLVGSVILAITLLRTAYVAFTPLVNLLLRATDDSFYYLNVARNIMLGRGVTFDGINPTNGFHPLWMLMLLPVYRVTGDDAALGFRAAFVLVTVLTGITLWVGYRAIGALAGRSAALLGVAFLLMPFSLNAMLNGLETGLLILLLFLCFWMIPRYRLLSLEAPPLANAAFGALLGLVFLARLDSAFIVLVVGLAIILHYLRMGSSRPSFGVLLSKGVVMGVAFALLALPYFVWNFKTFGHLTPISGALKSSFPRVTLDWQRFESFDTLYGLSQIVVCTVCLVLVRRMSGSRPATRDEGPEMLTVFWAGCCLHFLYSLCFINWAAHWWHYGAYIPLTTILIAMVFDRIAISRRFTPLRTGSVVAAALVMALAGNYADIRLRKNDHTPWYEAAMWADKHLPSDAVIGMTDCGLFGYFCGRPTVNMDGVINGYDYQAALRDGRLAEYLGRCGVTHMADYEVDYEEGRHWIRLPARLYRSPGMAMLLTSGGEIYHSQPFRHSRAKSETVFAIWPIDSARIMPMDQATRRPLPSEESVVAPLRKAGPVSLLGE